MSENKGYMHPEVLVDADWVEAHLHDANVRLIEVDVDTKSYAEAHIPGAVGLNWQKELQDQVVRAPISPANLEALLSAAGVGNDTRSEEHTSELQSHLNLVCRLLLEKKKKLLIKLTSILIEKQPDILPAPVATCVRT